MNSRKSILRYGIILYICVFLTGGPSVVSSFAKITVKEPVEGKVITIKQGDTLWDLAEEWLKDPLKWPEFKKYNEYTNPDLIYPGEDMQIPIEMAREIAKVGEKEIARLEYEIKALQNSNQDISNALKSQTEELEALKKAIDKLNQNINQKAGKKRVENLEKKVASIDERLSEAEIGVKGELQKSVKQVNQLNENVDKIDHNVKALDGKVDQLAAAGQQQITEISQSVETLTTQITQNQESISRLETRIADTGEVEELSQGKKAFVILTTLAGGIAWFVVSSLSQSN
ncbi:LysM peptidoglycan-binding domain-containing protein [bacterium]|nr:LysM peptidoglycan-binding domain-containing protein [bacterium]